MCSLLGLTWATVVGVGRMVGVTRGPATFRLSPEVIAQHTAGQVVCLDHRADGRVFRLHAKRPGPRLNRIVAPSLGVGPDATSLASGPALSIVEIRGVLEQRAGYHDVCGGWTDGHDAIAERLISAFGDGDVVMVIDSPGGAHAGLEESVRRALDAKLDTGRMVYAIADEQIGSAAYWWAAAIADEIYTPGCGVIGSVGARSAHQSVAGALKKAGVAVEYFVYPGEGKAAFAPEMPLSDVGRERGIRDVTLAGESFARAVEMGRGLSIEQIMALDADCLTGQAAVDAGLADGVASLEDVIAHALAGVSEQETSMANRNQRARAEEYEREEKTIKERYEGDEPEPEDMEPEDEGDEPDERDEGDEPEPDDEAEPEPDDEGDEPEEEDEGDEPDKGMKTRASRARRRVTASGTVGEILGLRRSASALAVKTEVRKLVGTLNATMAELEVDSPGALVGAARAIAQDARQVASMRASVRKTRRQANARRRTDLAKQLVKAGLPGYTRGDVYIDTYDERGDKRTALAPVYQEMKLATFEGFVKGKLKNAGPKARRTGSPFSPDRGAVKSATVNGDMATSLNHPVVQAAIRNSQTKTDPELYAAAHAAMFGNASAGDPAV